MMTLPQLESIPGDLLAYRQLEPASILHGYEITNERRTCADEKARAELRNNSFYVADGQLYTAKKREVLWGITKLPQNLVLRNIDEAYRQLTQTGNYFPLAEEAKVSFEHADTVIVDLKGLKLVKDNDEYGHFVLDPKKSKKLNSQQKKAAVRLFGPDEESFGLNMEMLAEAEESPFVFALMPDYVQRKLKVHDKQYVGRASWLNNFINLSNFNALARNFNSRYRVRGVRRASEAFRQESHERSDLTSQREQGSPAGRALENAGVPSNPIVPPEVRTATMEEILAFTRQEGFVAERNWRDYEAGVRQRITGK